MNIFNDVLSIIIGIAKDLGIEEKDILDRITAEPPKNKEYGENGKILNYIPPKESESKDTFNLSSSVDVESSQKM